jgi:ParB-like chromosome segregation protein Spo0J
VDSRFTQKKLIRWPISKLRTHSKQVVFSPHAPAQINELAASLDRDGLINAVEITPDGTIICGHGRVAAAKQLGWSTITCWVRHDLTEQGDDAIFQRLVEDNLHRRQLTKIGLGRAFLALKKQECGKWSKRDQGLAKGDLRDYLGEVLGCDGTTAERWSRLADLPFEYDQLIEGGLLTQQLAQKVVKLPPDVQTALVKKLMAIASEGLPRTETRRRISMAVQSKTGKPKASGCRNAKNWIDGLRNPLEQALTSLPGTVAEIMNRRAAVHNEKMLLATARKLFPDCQNEPVDFQIELSEEDRATLRKGALFCLRVLSLTEPA